MRKVLLTLLALITVSTTVFAAYNFNKEVPLPGKSIADTKVQSDSLFQLYAFAIRAAAPDCQDFAVTDTNVVKAKENGTWEELWTVKACTRTINIPVKFTEQEDGSAIFAIDPMGVRVSK